LNSFIHFFIGALIFGGSLVFELIVHASYQSFVICKAFLLFCGLPLQPSDICFVVQKPFNFIYSHLSILSFCNWAIWVIFRKSLPMSINSSVCSAFYCSSFKVSGLVSSSSIVFELILVQDERHG
jgi:hypothetical protein